MYTLKGFFSMPAIANNNVNMVANIGELSNLSRTFSKEIREFSYPEQYSHVQLLSFKLVNDSNQPITPLAAFTKKIVAIGEWLYGQHQAGSIPANTQKLDFYANLQTQFPECDWIGMGDIIASEQSPRNMPEWIEFKLNDETREYAVKVWLSDSSFANTYDEFEISVFPCVDPIDLLDNDASTVLSLLEARTIGQVIQQARSAMGNYPFTDIDTLSLDWHDPSGIGTIINTQWVLIGWGPMSRDVDNKKNAVRDYLATNSTKTNWQEILPSLYQENEFVIIPLWDNIAVPETSLDHGLYASIISTNGLNTKIKDRVPTSYGSTTTLTTYITTNAQYMAVYYRGMMVGVLGNPSNTGGVKKLTQLFADYTYTAPDSSDFERLSPTTRNFVTKLNDAIGRARTFSINNVVPNGFYRVIRNNRVYLSFLYNGFQYLVLTRETYNNV